MEEDDDDDDDDGLYNKLSTLFKVSSYQPWSLIKRYCFKNLLKYNWKKCFNHILTIGFEDLYKLYLLYIININNGTAEPCE
jgi:hypothetical protein